MFPIWVAGTMWLAAGSARAFRWWAAVGKRGGERFERGLVHKEERCIFICTIETQMVKSISICIG